MTPTQLPLLPGAQPLSGHAHEIRHHRLRFLDRVVDDGREIVRASVFGKPLVVVNTPELVQQLLVENAKSVDKSFVLRWVLYPLAGEGLFTSRGARWRKQRKLMAPLFQPSQLAHYADAMVQCATRTVETWRDGQSVDVARETTRITMSVAGKTLFDADTFDDADELGSALTVALEWASSGSASLVPMFQNMARRRLLRWSERMPAAPSGALAGLADRMHGPLYVPGAKGRELDRAIAVLDAQVQRMIEERRASGLAQRDLMTQLLTARDDDGARMTDKQVRDEVLTLFVAGHETTATGLAWSLYCLAKRPSLYEAVRREALALGRVPRLEDTPRLSLTLAVFKEALRLYPPVYVFSRATLGPVTLRTERGEAVELPPEAVVFVSPYALHRRAADWPNPDQFDPTRFLVEEEAHRSRYAYLPFGAGPRVCIGNHFALMEAQLVLATLLQRADFELVSSRPVRPEPSATLRPRGGVPMRIRLRDRPMVRDLERPARASGQQVGGSPTGAR